MEPFVLLFGVAWFFGFTVLTGDTLASAVAAILAGVAAYLTRRTHREVDPAIEHNGKPVSLGEVVRRLTRSHIYLRQRFHTVLNAEYRTSLYLWRIGLHLGIPAEDWPRPTEPSIHPINPEDPFGDLPELDVLTELPDLFDN